MSDIKLFRFQLGPSTELSSAGAVRRHGGKGSHDGH